MEEMRNEPKKREMLPWLIGMSLLALLLLGLALVLADPRAGWVEDGAGAVDKAREKKKDETPRRLQQWADLAPDPAPATIPRRAA